MTAWMKSRCPSHAACPVSLLLASLYVPPRQRKAALNASFKHVGVDDALTAAGSCVWQCQTLLQH